MNRKIKFSVIAAAIILLLGTIALCLAHPALSPLVLGVIGVLPFLAVTSTQNRFQDTPCKVVVSNNFDTHGTITRASVAHLTPAQLESLFRPGGLFADMDDALRTAFEMKACGTVVNGMYDWVMSSQRYMGNLLNPEKVDKGPTLLRPYVLGRQDSVINKEFWAISTGYANSAYTALVTGPLSVADKALGAAGDRVIRVVNRYGIDLDAKWFIDRDRVSVFNLVNGAAANGQWKVLASEVASDLSYVDVLVTSENSGSTTIYDTAPTGGVLLEGANNVNDFETWCNNRPTLDPRKRVPYWYQAMRRGRRVDSEYKAVFARLMESNEYFRQFGDLPLAERNRQDEADWQRKWLISFFFGKKISANQTLANWQSLEQIKSITGATLDPGQGGKLMGYRANMVGVFEQLQACGQVTDLQNNQLNFYEWLSECYRIYRARDSQGKVVDSLDWFTDSVSSADIQSAVVAYYRKEYGDIIRLNIETGKDPVLGWKWYSFNVKYPAGVTLNIVTHKFFDDIANAFANESMASMGNFLLCLDIGSPGPKGGTIYPGMIASNRKQRTLGQIEQLARLDPTFACTMESPTEEISLISETCTAVVECPANSRWIWNRAPGVPNTGGQTVPYGDLY